MNLSGTGLEARWFNPRDPNAVLGAALAVSAVSADFTPPSDVNQDWVLWVTDGTNLNDPVTHPTGGAQILQYAVPEPTAWALLLGGLLALLAARQRDGWPGYPVLRDR